jgi:hypothetical protein
MIHRPHARALALPALLASVLVALAPWVARADVVPGKSRCTPDRVQRLFGGHCEACYKRPPDPCQDALAAKGYTLQCSEGSGDSFVAVWCQPEASSPPAVVVSPGSDNRRGSRCGVSPGAYGLLGVAGPAALAAALALAARRRRRR